MPEDKWKTGITEIKPNRIVLRGYPIDDLMGRISFAQAIYLALKGEFPSPEVGRLVDAIFVSSIDHGASPPSVLAARTVASTGADLNAAVAAGVLAINRFHGGAIEEGQRLFLEIARRAPAPAEEPAAIKAVLEEMKAKGKRASGYGHRIHTQDPRTAKLFALAEELGLAGRFVRIASGVEKALAEQAGGKPLPINVDGAIAALLCELGIPPEIGNAFFIISRVPGLVAHVHEEKTRMKPMRKIDPEGYEYDGPPERKLP
jgi:citrate synthase